MTFAGEGGGGSAGAAGSQNSEWVSSVRLGAASYGGGAAPRGAVLLQQRHAAEGARTDATLVLLHLGVGLQVGPQVGAVGKGPVAVGAGEGALTCTGKSGSRGKAAV